MKKRLIFHPFLFAAYQILFLYTHNIEDIEFAETFRILIAALLLAGFFFAVFAKISQDTLRAGVMATCSLLTFFSFIYFLLFSLWAESVDITMEPFLREHFHYSVFQFYPFCALYSIALELLLKQIFHTRAMFLSIQIWSVFFGLFFFAALNLSRQKIEKATVIFNIACAYLLLTVSVPICQKYFDEIRYSSSKVKQADEKSLANSYRPNVYLIVLDGYARQDVLMEVYNYDNSPFINYLLEKNFYVAQKSRANYPFTRLSLASELNLAHLKDMNIVIESSRKKFGPAEHLIKESLVRKFFKERGYKYIGNTTSTNFLSHDKTDYSVRYQQALNPFEVFVIFTTPFSFLNDALKLHQYEKTRGETLWRLQYTTGVAKDPEPTFIYTHVRCPHPPFVFGKNGEEVRYRGFGIGAQDGSQFTWGIYSVIKNYQKYYKNQLHYLNSVVMDTIDEILEQSPEPPIIILESDHGPGSLLVFSSAEQTYLKERFSNLLAFHFPDKDYKALYQDMTLVNAFVVVLNQYFGGSYKLLPGRSYFSTRARPYDFTDITDRIK